jgi:hypothetical protein
LFITSSSFIMKCLILAAVLVAAVLADQQCLPAMFQARAEVYNHPGLFWDLGMWIDFNSQQQLNILNPVPGNSQVQVYLYTNGVAYSIEGNPDDNNGYTPTSCQNMGSGMMMERCLNLSQWYSATVGGWGGMGGFKTNVYTNGMMVNHSYTQAFMYQHGMGPFPTWYRQYNATDMTYGDYNFYDAANLKNMSVFTVPSICMNSVPKPEFSMSKAMATVLRSFWKSA